MWLIIKLLAWNLVASAGVFFSAVPGLRMGRMAQESSLDVPQGFRGCLLIVGIPLGLFISILAPIMAGRMLSLWLETGSKSIFILYPALLAGALPAWCSTDSIRQKGCAGFVVSVISLTLALLMMKTGWSLPGVPEKFCQWYVH